MFFVIVVCIHLFAVFMHVTLLFACAYVPCIITSPFLLPHVLQVTYFPPPLMFIYFLMILLHALYLSVKYHPFWSCFGRVQKWLMFESISNLNYFSVLKNAQSNLFKFYTNSGLQGYSHISPNPRHIPVLFGLYFSV